MSRDQEHKERVRLEDSAKARLERASLEQKLAREVVDRRNAVLQAGIVQPASGTFGKPAKGGAVSGEDR